MAGLTQTLALKQKQTLTPQMIQALYIINQSSQELQEYVAKAVEENPALRLIDKRTESLDQFTTSHTPREELSDSPYQSYQDSHSALHQQMIEGTLSQAESLQEHLLGQLHLQKLSPGEMQLGEVIIQNLDENGFHRESLNKITPQQLQGHLERVLSTIQRLDPIGTGVNNVQESLLVQAEVSGLSPSTIDLIKNHLYDIHMANLERSAKELHIPLTDLEHSLRELQLLTPYPGIEFSTESTKYVAPDLTVIRKGEHLELRLMDDQIPAIELDPEFLQLAKELEPLGGDLQMGDSLSLKETSLALPKTFTASTETPTMHPESSNNEASSYMAKQIAEAEQLIHLIGLRSSSLLKVGAFLLEEQREFFLKGKKHLVSLTQKDAAKSLEISDSTVSRIANGKYIQTEWGLFPLKFFFSQGASPTSTGNSDAPTLSRESIKVIIQEIIEEHDGVKRISDEKIKTALEAKGISIARRTVAKYRKELAIESSFDRV